MRTLYTKIILSILVACLSLTMLTCLNDDQPSPGNTKELTEAYVIGFDQCLAGLETNIGRGFLLATSNSNKDTVMTYNLPDSVFIFPRKLFTNWWLSPFFPDTAQTQYRLLINYRIAEKNELIFAVCPGYVLHWPITFKAEQVVLICVNK